MIRHLPLLLVLGTLALTGCGGPGGGSPQAVFERAKAAAKNEDYHELMNCIHVDDVKNFASVMVTMTQKLQALSQAPIAPNMIKELMEKFENVLKKHNITRDKTFDINQVANVRGLAADMMEVGKDFTNSTLPIPQTSFSAAYRDATLGEVKINGDKATGSIASGERTSTIHFRNEGGRWYIGLPNRIPQ